MTRALWSLGALLVLAGCKPKGTDLPICPETVAAGTVNL